MSGETLVNQRGEPIAMVITDKASHYEVLGPPLPPGEWGAVLDVGADGKAAPAGDFPIRHPNSGKAGKRPALQGGAGRRHARTNVRVLGKS